MKIKIFSVGGTIDKVYFDQLSEYQVGFPSVREILDGLPVAFEYEVESLLRKDSLDMDAAERERVMPHVNLTPFRGPSADAGTVFELGFMRALGRPVMGYSNAAADFLDRTRGFLGAAARPRSDGGWDDQDAT